MKLFGRKEKEKETKENPQGTVGAEAALVDKSTVTLSAGGDAHAYQVIVKPYLTEKASLAGAQNKYVFRVGPKANKIEIKNAIEKLYRVKVKKVAITSIPAKQRRLGKQIGFRSGYKKAVVTLQTGEKMDVAG